MPWNARSAHKHTRKAVSQKDKSDWAHTANAVLRETGDEGKAIRIANWQANKQRKSKA